jgi:hypothetical protein
LKIILKSHAYFEIERRDIEEGEVLDCVNNPGQILKGDRGRFIYQKILYDKNTETEYLLRVIVEKKAGNLEVITAYKTSKIKKYWRE